MQKKMYNNTELNKKRSKLVMKSIIIGLVTMFVIYTVYFLYQQMVILPAEYALIDGKGVRDTNFYCVSVIRKGVVPCRVLNVIHQYFIFGILGIFFLPFLFIEYPFEMIIYTILVFSISRIYFNVFKNSYNE